MPRVDRNGYNFINTHLHRALCFCYCRYICDICLICRFPVRGRYNVGKSMDDSDDEMLLMPLGDVYKHR